MRKIYERSWLGVDYASLGQLSTQVLASPDFWEAFYQAVFQRVNAWTDIDPVEPDYRHWKEPIAGFIFGRIESSEAILSIGCGLGWVEHRLLELTKGTISLEVTEVAPSALKLIRREIPESHVHMGFFPQCIPVNRSYSLIFMFDTEPCMDQSSLTVLLRNIKDHLAPGGRFLLISSALDFPVSVWWKLLRAGKNMLAPALEAASLFHRGQFLGWFREKEELYDAFSGAGYSELREGFINAGPNPVGYFWIEARNS